MLCYVMMLLWFLNSHLADFLFLFHFYLGYFLLYVYFEYDLQ